MTVFMSEDENQMVEVLLEFSEEYSDRSSWIEFVKKIEEITKTESRLLKAGIQSCPFWSHFQSQPLSKLL